MRTFLAVVGAPGTPTPYGRYAIYEKIAQRDPNSIIGPWALHLTAFFNVLDNFGGGPAGSRSTAARRLPDRAAGKRGLAPLIRVEDSEVGFLPRHDLGTPVNIVA